MSVPSLFRVLLAALLAACVTMAAPVQAQPKAGVEILFAKPGTRAPGLSARTFRPEVSYRITFTETGVALSPRNAEMLDKIAVMVIANPKVPFAIVGQQETGGSGEVLELAIDRAENVARYLVSKGVPADRVQDAWTLGAAMSAQAQTFAQASSGTSETSPKPRSGSESAGSKRERNDNRNGDKHDK